MHPARKPETKYEHDKHNNSFCNYVMESGVVVNDSEGLPTKDDFTMQAAQWAQLTDMQEQLQELSVSAKAAQYLGNHPEYSK